MGFISLGATKELRIETDPESVQRPKEEPAPSFIPIGASELPADRLDGGRPEWLGRKGNRSALHEAQTEQLGIRAQDEVANDATGPATRPHAQPGVAEGIRQPPTE